jgi:hypothetical protein
MKDGILLRVRFINNLDKAHSHFEDLASRLVGVFIYLDEADPTHVRRPGGHAFFQTIRSEEIP